MRYRYPQGRDKLVAELVMQAFTRMATSATFSLKADPWNVVEGYTFHVLNTVSFGARLELL